MRRYRFLSVITVLMSVLLVVCSITVAFAADAGHKKGDVNGDTNINMEDVVGVQKHIAKLTTYEGDDAWAADVTFDGEIMMTDVTTIQKYVAKLIPEFTEDSDDGLDDEGWINEVFKP